MLRISIVTCLYLASTHAIGLDYERDIMPIFEKKCFECHSDQAGKTKGGLKLDDPEHFHARFEKNSVVIPGDWDASYLFITLYRPPGHEDAMPPEGKGERLTPEEVTLVQRWITEGAPIAGERGETGTMPEVMPEKPEQFGSTSPLKPREWTNRDGKTITATLLRVDGEFALLRMQNGKVYRYEIKNLSDESRAALESGGE